ncbi:MAG: diguanylate cyclase [Planctomycetota bacterium]|nr:diguanylate cyclase [Planctomycetota bacterium]
MKSSILIVDDSVFLHKLVRAHLEGEAIDLHFANSGEEGLSAAVNLKPSLILLDVDMPEMNGFEVCRRLKANMLTENIPIIFLTADIASEDKVKGLNLGAGDYITKPFKPEELRARVRAALRNKSQVEQVAMVDELTKLWNRTYLDLHLPAQLSLSRRTNRPLTCIIGDIDGLGKINENHGEVTGDEVVQTVAKIISGQSRGQDIVCYLGNGRFAALLPGTDRDGAVLFADRCRAEIERQTKNHDGTDLNATCSFGVSDWQAQDNSSLLDRADASLFCAKQSGRNCTSINQPTAAQACGVN